MSWKPFWIRLGIRKSKVQGPRSKVLKTLGLVLVALTTTAVPARTAVDVLSPIGGLPPQLVGRFREAAAFVETADGRYLVFDRRAQAVFSVDAKKTALTKLIQIGPSDGEILQPEAFVLAPDRTFSILDNPGNYQRVQTFYDNGTPLSVFRRWPAAGDAPRLSIDTSILSGLGPIATTMGRDVLAQVPDGVALLSRFSADGRITQQIDQLRATGHERDARLHQALNAGLPLVAPDGSLYFVFTAGIPMFRKYTPDGALLFERHIEGPELDGTIQSLPTEWPTRRVEAREFPNVTSTVRTAAVDGRGRIWISLTVPFTYVYDAAGNKVRTVQFRGAGVISPGSLFFARDGHLLVTPGCYEFAVN